MLFHQTAFALLFSSPETNPFPADSAQIPPRALLGSLAMPAALQAWGCAGGSCPSLLPAAAAGPCRVVMRMKPLSRRERGWQRGADGAWMLSQHLPLGGKRRQRCLGILLPPASALIKAASGRCSINSRHIQLHQPGRRRAPACRGCGHGMQAVSPGRRLPGPLVHRACQSSVPTSRGQPSRGPSSPTGEGERSGPCGSPARWGLIRAHHHLPKS